MAAYFHGSRHPGTLQADGCCNSRIHSIEKVKSKLARSGSRPALSSMQLPSLQHSLSTIPICEAINFSASRRVDSDLHEGRCDGSQRAVVLSLRAALKLPFEGSTTISWLKYPYVLHVRLKERDYWLVGSTMPFLDGRPARQHVLGVSKNKHLERNHSKPTAYSSPSTVCNTCIFQ